MKRVALALLLLPAAARAGALWLQSGRVVEGTVTRNGSVYVVTNAGGRQVFPVPGVLLAGESKVDLYRELAATHKMPGDAVKLARWCLDAGLQAQAKEQLAKLPSSAKLDPQIAELFRRAEEAAVPSAPSDAPKPPPVRSFNLSTRTVTHYRSRVAPLLKNGCGTARCHGPGTTRPLTFGAAARPAEVRAVLAETLRRLDPLDPANSPLITMATTPHGGSKRPPLAGRYADQQVTRIAEFASAAAAEMRLTRADRERETR